MAMPRGKDLKDALAEAGLSTDGMGKNANGDVFESEKQAALMEVHRQRREEREVANAEQLTLTTKHLGWATWLVGVATFALFVASIVQIVVTLSRK